MAHGDNLTPIFKKFFYSVLLIAILSLNACTNFNSPQNVDDSQLAGNYKDEDSSYHVRGHDYHVLKTAENYDERGTASWYGRRFHRLRTSSGARYNQHEMTAAHKTLPLSTYVEVTNLDNGKKVIVKINDRGPFAQSRLIDLSYAAAKKIGMLGTGTADVEVKALTSEEVSKQRKLLAMQKSKKNNGISSKHLRA